jgi:glucuronosyltransferase
MVFLHRFKERAKLMSEINKDQMNTPLERAMFWTNHVLKFKGAPHLRSSARQLNFIQLNFIQLHSIDVLLFLVLILITFWFLTRNFSKKTLQFIHGKKKEKQS